MRTSEGLLSGIQGQLGKGDKMLLESITERNQFPLLFLGRLVMVRPKKRIPRIALLHALLPFIKQVIKQDFGPERLSPPFVPIIVIDLQMEEAECHGKLLAIRDAILQTGGTHLTHSEVVLQPAIVREFGEILMNTRTIRIEAPAIPPEIILEGIRLGNKVDDIEPKPHHSFSLPEAKYILQCLAHLNVIPVQVRLLRAEQVQVPFIQGENILPCTTTEFGSPVGGGYSGCLA